MTDRQEIPYIDIAVSDGVREAMLSGSAAVLFDADASSVLWANGAAAKLFGYGAISEFRVAGIEPFRTALRQIRSIALQAPDQPRKLMLRVTAGMGSQLLSATATRTRLALLDDDTLLLTVTPEAAPPAEKALAMAIAGLEEDGAAAAILDGEGSVLAAGRNFDGLGIAAAELAALAGETATEDDRLVKRLVPGASAAVAVGIGRLCDEPGRYLLIAVETDEDFIEDEIAETPVQVASVPDMVEDVIPSPSPAPVEQAAETIATAEAPRGPVRFVWKTDADGRFIDVSPEFGSAVGPNAADIIGRSFEDVARVFELDPSGEIAASMRRRDTWSGKSVLWPVQGTDLRVPVDLAALPYYNRERLFEGYRGFGIVRVGDTVVDPEELGLALADPFFSSKEEPDNTDAQDDVTPETDDPFNGEVPALSSSAITPQRRDSDKIIPLDARRRSTESKLDDDARDAFEKIGKALGGKPVSEEPDEAPAVFGRRNQTVADAPSMDMGSHDGDDDDDGFLDFDDEGDRADEETIDDTTASNWLDSVPEGLDDAMEAFDRQADLGESPVEAEPASGLGPEILDGLPLPMLVVRGEEAIFANRAFADLTGHEDIAALNATGLGNLFEDGTPDEGDEDVSAICLVGSDGRIIPARAHLQIVPWAGTRALMFAFEPLVGDAVSVAEEVRPVDTMARHLQSTAFDEVSELRAILDTATDGVVVIGPEGTIRSLNDSASALFGYSNEEAVGKSFTTLFAHESQRAALDYLNGLTSHGVASVLNEGREVLGRERNGGFLPLFMTMGRLPTDAYCAVLRDITPWKQTEQALQEARKAAEDASNTKSDFLAKISHEIRTPLNAIIGFSELMAEERFGPIGNQRYRDYLVDINKSGRHVLDLVNDLLDISKIEAGEQDLEFESVKLNDAVADAIAMVQPQANRNRIIIRTSTETGLPPVVADRRSVKQIVLNLLSNAIRFTHAGGQVVVTTTYTRSGAVVMRIRDTGIGMTAKEIETALQPFQQVASLGRERGDGTGLGLPLTKALVEANRAEFAIASEPGQGTVVEITFPPARVLAE